MPQFVLNLRRFKGFQYWSLLGLFVLYLASGIHAEQLPLKTYTSAEGLASGTIVHVSKDSRGFLWFSTREGLSRFDGREFVNFRLENLIDSPNFNATIETRDGFFWIAANDGTYRIKPDFSTDLQPENVAVNSNDFRVLKAEKVSNVSPIVFFEDSRGRLWGAGNELLLIADESGVKSQKYDLGAIARVSRNALVKTIFESRDQSLWVGCDAGIIRITNDNRRILYPIPRQTEYDETEDITEDATGRIWVAHSTGVFVFLPEPLDETSNLADQTAHPLPIEEKAISDTSPVALPSATGRMTRFIFEGADNPSTASGKKTWNIDGMFKSSDGKIWVPTSESLFIFDGENCRRLSSSDGFLGAVTSIVEDNGRNIWLATVSGAMKFEREGLTSWRLADGLTDPRVHSIYEDETGALLVIHGEWRVSRITENKIESVQLDLPDDDRYLWTTTAALPGDSKNWWALSAKGLYNFSSDFASLGKIKPSRIFGQKDGFRSNQFYTAFRDSKGNIWFSTRATPTENGLAMLEKETGKFRFFSTADGFPDKVSICSFAEDKDGNIWFGIYAGGGLLRYSNGRFTDFSKTENLPRGSIFGLLFDQKGHLWIGSTRDGVSMVENPSAERLNFKSYTTEQGLSSNIVRAMTKDLYGNIYIGTTRGVDRLNPETGNIRHYTTADGLASDTITALLCDRQGRIWFGTPNGLSRLERSNEDPAATANLQVFINGLQIAGVRYGVSEFGNQEIKNIKVSSAENNLKIDFTSIGESGLRFQYRFEGGDNDGKTWSNSTSERAVNFAGLAPDTYTFAVRAIDSAGRTSENPATVSFTIAPPFWRTWEFIGGMLFIAAVSVFLLDRYRVSKTRQVRAALTKSQESETRFRTLAQTASDAIVTINEDSIIMFVNPAIEKIFGYAPDEILGKKLNILMPSAFRSENHAGISHYLRSHKRKMSLSGIELPGQHKSGKEIPLEVSFGEFDRDGQHYFTGVIRDISERKIAEEALRKSREERLKELQRVRTRIATDLHDDIGSSLTQIAVLSEVARSQSTRETVKTPLNRISDVSNELVDAMSDIVWAINPKKDNLRELVLRMRRFASDVLSAREIEFEFDAPEADDHIQLGANIRREVLSIYKECVNNIVKHSGATEVNINFEIFENNLRLEIRDNGRGFDVEKILSENFSPDKGGNGLINMRRRAAELGGGCEIFSKESGTTITLDIPLQSNQSGEDIHVAQSSGNSAIHSGSDSKTGNGLH